MRANKPTTESILQLYDKMVLLYGGLHQKFATDEDFYELNFKTLLKMPAEFKTQGTVLPTARDMVDTFVDHIDVGNASIKTNKKNTTAKSKEEQEMLRKLAYGIIHRTKVEADISPWRVAAKHYALHGLAVFKVLWDADLWPGKPERGEGENDKNYQKRIDKWKDDTHLTIPIVIQAVNPGCVMPDPGHGGREFVFEVHKRTVLAVQERWSHYKAPPGKNIDDEVDVISFWTKHWHAEFADREVLLPVDGGVDEHSYDFIPYVFIDSGLGNLAMDSSPTKRYVGILRHITDLLISESRNYSISDIVLALTAWPWGYLTGKNAKRVKKVTQQFGTWTPLPDGVEPKPMVAQVPPRALSEHLDRTYGYISGHAAPPSVRGMPEQGVRSAADRRLMIAEGTSKYKYSEEAFRNGTAKVLTYCARLMKNVVPGNARVWAMTPADDIDIEIQRDRLVEPFTYYVEFAPISEEDEYRRHDDLERMVTSGIFTPKDAWKRLPDVNPEDMELSREMWKLQNNPALDELKTQYAAGKLMQEINKRMMAEGISPGGMMGGMGGGMGGGQGGGIMGRMTTDTQGAGETGTKNSRTAPLFPNQGAGGGGAR